jgi:hypothetical protein
MDEAGRTPRATPPGILRRLAGLVMIASVVFVILGDEPVIEDFFGTQDEKLRLQYLLDAPDDWDRAMTMYAISGVVVALGFALWAGAVHLAGSDRTLKRAADVGGVSALLGALAWVSVCYGRATRPPAEVADNPDILQLWGLAWPLLAMLATALVGWILLRAHMRVRGWAIIVAAVIFVPIGIILPLAVPFPVALTGLIIMVARSSRRAPSVTSPEPLMP